MSYDKNYKIAIYILLYTCNEQLQHLQEDPNYDQMSNDRQDPTKLIRQCQIP